MPRCLGTEQRDAPVGVGDEENPAPTWHQTHERQVIEDLPPDEKEVYLMDPSAFRDEAGIWVDPSDPAFTTEGESSPTTEAPIIYLFSNSRDGDGTAYAMAEDGTVLGTHWCSHWGYMRHDLHDRQDRREACEEHYPDGYQVVVLGAGQVPPNSVIDRNRAQAEDAAS